MVEKLKVYLESSFISYLTGRETTDAKIASWQALSRKWWKDEAPRCELNVSVFVLNETRVGNKEQIRLRDEKLAGLAVLETVSPEIAKLAKLLMKRHAVPVTEAAGYACPLITTPERFLEDTEK